jgi:hypothetical protein
MIQPGTTPRANFYFAGGVMRVPSLPVYGFLFGFVDQLLLNLPSGSDCRWGATYVPFFRVYPLTE